MRASSPCLAPGAPPSSGDVIFLRSLRFQDPDPGASVGPDPRSTAVRFASTHPRPLVAGPRSQGRAARSSESGAGEWSHSHQWRGLCSAAGHDMTLSLRRSLSQGAQATDFASLLSSSDRLQALDSPHAWTPVLRKPLDFSHAPWGWTHLTKRGLSTGPLSRILIA